MRFCFPLCRFAADVCSALTGRSIDYNAFAGPRRMDNAPPASYGGATPARVPEWTGSRTPLPIDTGGRTPAWQLAARSKFMSRSLRKCRVLTHQAPAWAGGGSSSRTPAWQRPDGAAASGRTPAYGAEGGRTVNPYADGGRTAYGGGVSNLSQNSAPYSADQLL